MKNFLTMLMVAAFVLTASSAYAAVGLVDVWPDAAGSKIVTDINNNWLGDPKFDVEELGLKITDSELSFAVLTKFKIDGGWDEWNYIGPGDFMFDMNGDGIMDSGIDYAISGNDVAFDFYKNVSNFINGQYYPYYDPIAVDTVEELALGNTPSSFSQIGGYQVYPANNEIAGTYYDSFLLFGKMTAAQAGLAAFDANMISMSWSMECGNGGLKITPVPEPATMAMLGLSALGLAAFRRKK